MPKGYSMNLLRRNSIIIWFNIWEGREVNVWVHWRNIIGGEGDAVIMRGVDVVEVVKCGLHVTGSRLTSVGRKKGVSHGKVGTCGWRQPTDAADETLISFFTMKLCRWVISIKGRCNGVDGNARSIRSSCWSFVAGPTGKTSDKVHGKTRLVEMDSYQRRGEATQKTNTKKTFDNSHEIDLATFSKKMTEEGFDRGIFQEIDKVVDVHPEG
jgi:hypothetical protein